MAVRVQIFLEFYENSRWCFRGDFIPNPDSSEFTEDEPKLMPEPFFESWVKEYAAIFTDSGNPIRSTEPYIPIVPRRGRPTDLSPEVLAWLKRDDNEPASFMNWFTVQELLDFDLSNRFMRKRAMVAAQNADLFAGCPRGFPKDGWPEDSVIRIAEQMRDGVVVEWMESYAESVQDFFARVPKLLAMGEPNNMRLIVNAAW